MLLLRSIRKHLKMLGRAAVKTRINLEIFADDMPLSFHSASLKPEAKIAPLLVAGGAFAGRQALSSAQTSAAPWGTSRYLENKSR